MTYLVEGIPLNVITIEKSAYYVVKVLSDEGIATKKVFIK